MNESGNANVYRIGAVANLTGLSTHTIRAWERRYGMELSDRSEGGTRLYSEASLERLMLIKKLLDQGESISVLTELTIPELDSRLAQFAQRTGQDARKRSHLRAGGRIRLAVFGKPQLDRDVYRLGSLSAVEVVFRSEDAESFSAFLEAKSDAIDCTLLCFDVMPTRHPNVISDWVSVHPEMQWVVLYELGAKRDLVLLLEKGVKCLKGPLPDAVLMDLIGDIAGGRVETDDVSTSATTGYAPIFSAEQLNKLANLPSSIQCECPSHMSALIHNLNTFEKYCHDCENSSEEDTELHAELGRETAKARSILEQMLVKVCAHDNIRI